VKALTLQFEQETPDDSPAGGASVKRQSGRDQTITMRDVAKSSGFSPATVSIVLNNAPLARYIAPTTKKRIEEVAKKLATGRTRWHVFFAANGATASE